MGNKYVLIFKADNRVNPVKFSDSKEELKELLKEYIENSVFKFIENNGIYYNEETGLEYSIIESKDLFKQ